MAERVPLSEQLDEIRGEYVRRCQMYPGLVARGQMRSGAAEFKLARMAAAYNTLAWLLKHADQVRDWVEISIKLGTSVARTEMHMDAPPDVLPDELAWDEVDADDGVEKGPPEEEAAE